MGENFWSSLLTSSIAIIVLFVLILITYYIMNFRGVKKQKEHFSNLHQALKVGNQIVLGNGIYAKVVAVNGDIVDIKVKSGAIMEVSRYSISKIVD